RRSKMTPPSRSCSRRCGASGISSTGALKMYRQPVRVLAEVWRALWRKLQWRLFAAFVVILIAAVSVQTITADFFAWRSIEGYVETHRTSALNIPGALARQALWGFTISLFLPNCRS